MRTLLAGGCFAGIFDVFLNFLGLDGFHLPLQLIFNWNIR